MSQEYDREESENSGMAFFTGLLAGALIGAGLGVLFAPRRGSELRKQVADSATSVGKAVSKTVDTWTEQGRDAYDRVRDVASRAGNLVDRVTADAARTAETTMNFAGDMASEASRRAANTAAAARG